MASALAGLPSEEHLPGKGSGDTRWQEEGWKGAGAGGGAGALSQ